MVDNKVAAAEQARQALQDASRAHRAATRALHLARQAALAAGLSADDLQDASHDTPGDGVVRAERIELVEPDGTVRLIIASRARFPGMILRGTEYDHPGRDEYAGMLFFNDDGTENGGLIFNGRADGAERSGAVHLSFDGVEKDQVIALTTAESPQGEMVRLEFNDQPGWTQPDIMAHLQGTAGAERRAAAIAYADEHGWMTSRMRLARETDGSVALRLRDGEGRDRIVLSVDAQGEASVQVLDAQGDPTAALGDGRAPA